MQYSYHRSAGALPSPLPGRRKPVGPRGAVRVRPTARLAARTKPAALSRSYRRADPKPVHGPGAVKATWVRSRDAKTGGGDDQGAKASAGSERTSTAEEAEFAAETVRTRRSPVCEAPQKIGEDARRTEASNLVLQSPLPAVQSNKGGGNKVWKRDLPPRVVTTTAAKSTKAVVVVPGASNANAPSLKDMTKRGSHSLVMKGNKRKLDGITKDEGNADRSHQNEKQASSTAIYGDRRGSATVRGIPVAKRIRLVSDQDLATEAQGQKPQENTAKGSGHDGAKLTAGLTDFAYRETSKTVERGQLPLGRRSSGQEGRNMGLVRVRSEESQMPVCRSFARGVPCTNEFCAWRHDVPPECAVPLCSYFQRNGQCLRRDTCPFRHVKVDPRAAVCSSFSLLGYCEDKDCKMKHVAR